MPKYSLSEIIALSTIPSKKASNGCPIISAIRPFEALAFSVSVIAIKSPIVSTLPLAFPKPVFGSIVLSAILSFNSFSIRLVTIALLALAAVLITIPRGPATTPATAAIFLALLAPFNLSYNSSGVAIS